MKLQKNSVADVIEEYQKTPEFSVKIRSEKTRQQYIYQLQRLCSIILEEKTVGDMLIQDLSVAKCQHIYWAIINGAEEGKGERFANYTLQVVTRAWNVLIKYDMLDKNPWSFVERSKPAPRNTVWRTENFTAFLKTAFSQPRWRNVGLLVRINVELGQRIEDIRLSEWDNYDLKEKLYTREVILKTNERIAGIPLSDALVQMIAEQKDVYDFQKWVVPNPLTLEPYTEKGIARTFRKIRAAAGLPSRLQLRDIRRTVLTDLANHGATDTEIMAYSGHKSRDSLMPYVRISTQQARNAAEKRQFSLGEDDEWKQFKRSFMTTEELLNEIKFKEE
jgi:integrase